MLDKALEFISNNGTFISDQLDYICSFNWADISRRKDRIGECSLQTKIINTALVQLGTVVKEAGDDRQGNEIVTNFCKDIEETTVLHISRCREYFDSEIGNWKEYPDFDEKADELEFQNSVIKDMLDLKNKLAKLNLNGDNKEVEISIYGNTIISLSMRAQTEERFPEIIDYLDRRKEKEKTV
jgi:hypothetical protein